MLRATYLTAGEVVSGNSEVADMDGDEEEFGIVNGLVLPAGSAALTPSGPQARQHKLRAQFGRKRTHNEQIIVAPCGIILARETFYGAEAVSTVVVCNSFQFPYYF
jgi:hypothetical protein